MDPAQASRVVHLLRQELTKHFPNLTDVVESFGQLDATHRRESGELFTLRDHLRGMILAMLSANRPWRPIADNLANLDQVFGGYRPSFLREADPVQLEAEIKRFRCGNRRVGPQMRAITTNLVTFERIEQEHGSIDAYMADRSVEFVVDELATHGRRYKLLELGPALVFEYLKNVGIRASKPDVHVVRILGADRLAVIPAGATPIDAFHAFREFAHAAGAHEVELDNLVWLLGAEEYAAVCGARPRCGGCVLSSVCRQGASS